MVPSDANSSPVPDGSHEALALFQRRYGAAATHLVYAPGRVNLIGEHTDYNGGFVLPMAIELGIYIAARQRADRQVEISSGQMGGEPARFDTAQPVTRGEPVWSNYVRGVTAGFQEAGVAFPGFDAEIFATLPSGGGLSSSAALEVATATLLETLSGVTMDPLKKALLCQRAEHDFAGTPCGIMDQFAVTFGQSGSLLLIDCHSMERRLVPMNGQDVAILVINTMVKHELTDGGYASRRNDCHEAARLLGVAELREATPQQVAASAALPDRIMRRARHVTTEDFRTLEAVSALTDGEWERLGSLMYASHESLRTDFEVSCAELDIVVNLAKTLGLENGVYGCRMTGGGFGGCCVALVDAARVEAISHTLREGYRAATGIDPVLFSTRPADGPATLLQP